MSDRWYFRMRASFLIVVPPDLKEIYVNVGDNRRLSTIQYISWIHLFLFHIIIVFLKYYNFQQTNAYIDLLNAANIN